MNRALFSFPRSAVTVALLLALSVACARKIDDAKISTEIQGKFGQDSGLGAKHLTVDSTNGVVTLSGTVDNTAQREAASRQAAAVAGVKQVVNNLQISDAVTAAAMPASPAMGSAPASIPASTAAKPTASVKAAPSKKLRKSRDSTPPASAASDNDSEANATPAADAPAPAPSTNSAPDNTPAAATQPPTPPAPKSLIVDQGTQVTVRVIDPIDSEKNQTGDTFRATLNAPLASDGEEAVPAGVELTGHLVEVKSAGKFAGQSEIVMQLDNIKAGGQTYTIQTDQYRKQAASRGKNTAEKVGGGAIIGGIIGAIAGGGKGAAIGSAAGAGVGGGVQAATKGQQIKLPSETVLNFTLQAPVTVVQSPKPDADRPKLENSQP